MTLKSGIFSSVNGDRKYKAEDFASYFATFISNGVFPNPSTGFQVTASAGMTVVLKAGQAWINGYFITNDTDYSLTLDVADGVLKRIDRIVLQLNHSSREIIPVIKKGTFASSPVAPAIQRDSDAYEIVLADVLVNNGVLSITQPNITDQRLNTALCGIVHGTVDQVDTTTIFNQYQSWFNQTKTENEVEMDEWMQQEQAVFNVWFATLENQLSGDIAANLQIQISQLDSDFVTLEQNVSVELEKAERISYSTIKSGVDIEGIFTVVEQRRKIDNTLARKSVLSGGVSPRYTTRTVTYYETDGTTLVKTDTFALTYDADGILTSEV